MSELRPGWTRRRDDYRTEEGHFSVYELKLHPDSWPSVQDLPDGVRVVWSPMGILATDARFASAMDAMSWAEGRYEEVLSNRRDEAVRKFDEASRALGAFSVILERKAGRSVPS